MIIDELAVARRRQQFLPRTISLHCSRGHTLCHVGQFELDEPDPEYDELARYAAEQGHPLERIWMFGDYADPLPGKLLRRSRKLAHVKKAQAWICPNGRVVTDEEKLAGDIPEDAYLRYSLRCNDCRYKLTRRADALWPVLDNLAARFVIGLALSELATVASTTELR